MIRERLRELGLELPEPVPSLYQYVPVVVHEGIAYISGQVPRVDGKLPFVGKVGVDVTIEQARELAKICVLKGLSSLEAEIGSLDRVERVLKVTGYVQSTDGFNQQPQVIDAASELLEQIFGEQGRHARTAVGAAELPGNTPVEIDFMIAVRR
ncbi:RidA family protein [Brevibacillus centrosporus]|uniref:Enamine deaminase RidA, house cleaning of reactive enamine intermediates, YjgF/YER057c/UK114 family n=1 Tax=Brevibacillus centrosporus TaxID=54910 RepID=A0A1I4CUI3_9BACL|nr:RidA family protein [Brevibacillus centrosporus]MED4911944.1 RidA family protein [Brevibacillus centrosporus]SFK84433.1 Enamine deaminase RidA, house cleaning of reactive enamine intermediates, YjgF/YER057c/UK114 family [Brevibacillus centrosporus]